MKTSGYPGTPLAKKLGIKAGFKIRLIGQPVYYFDPFKDMPANIHVVDEKQARKDLVRYFTKYADELRRDIPLLKNEIQPNGMIWISWPKKASKAMTDITEDVVRGLALLNGLVDIKVREMDEIGPGLKLVIPLRDRTPRVDIH